VKKDDQTLISECLQGETESFSELVRRYQDRLFNALVHVLRSREDARDVAQETFVRAYQRLETFRGQSAFYSWLFRIAINNAISYRRRTRLHSTSSIDATREKTGLEPIDSRSDSQPSYGLELSERQQQVQSALTQLTEEYRVVLVLKELEGFKYEEIAVIVDCPIGTVRSRIHRARAELRQKLEKLLKREDKSS